MINFFKNKLNKISLYLIFSLPFLDMYRALIGNRIEIFGISLVEIFHFLLTGILFLILIFNKDRRKWNKFKFGFLLFLYFLYVVGHLWYIYTINDISFINYSVYLKDLLIEFYYIFKSYLLPLIILFVYVKEELKTIEVIDVLSKICLFISGVIVVTNLLGVSFIAYNGNPGNSFIKGSIISWLSGLDNSRVDLYTSKGLFYSTNQLSAVLGSLLFISAFYTVYKNEYKYYFSFFIKVLSALMISTKTAFFSIFFSVIAVFIYFVIRFIFYREKKFYKKSFIFLGILLIIVGLYNYSPLKIKLSGYLDNQQNEEANDWNHFDDEVVDENICLEDKISELEVKYDVKFSNIDTTNLSKSERKFMIEYLTNCPSVFNISGEYTNFYLPKHNFEFWIDIINEKTSVVTNQRLVKSLIYEDFLDRHDNNFDYLFGIGYVSNFPYLERDVVGQTVWFGYLGVLLFIFPFVGMFLISLIRVFLDFKNKFNFINVSLLLSSAFMFFASILAGHVFGCFVPSTILAIIIASLYNNSKLGRDVKLKSNKISFLLLHLGYGGIESSTINTANALIDKYDVEIMSFYKLDSNQSNRLNDKISVIYLYDGGPNREKFIEDFRKFRILSIIKEGIKAVTILIKKRVMVINYICNSDSKYIVSTRWDFSILLSKYGKVETVKIAQEHHYHNNDEKYINVIKNKYSNIDYLFALTKCLENDYNKFLVNNKHTKVILMPNMLFDIPNKKSSLKEKNIITVSRLDYGKRNDDIIRAFSKIKDKNCKLYIIGDGKEYDNLNSLIVSLGLEKRIILTGYKNKTEIEEYMLNSSLFLMASITEGLPMVLLEAMSYGIPCIAYETDSGVNDIIVNNKNGFVIKNRNEDNYVEKINKVLTDVDLRKRLGKNAINTANSFSKNEILKKWNKILKNN